MVDEAFHSFILSLFTHTHKQSLSFRDVNDDALFFFLFPLPFFLSD